MTPDLVIFDCDGVLVDSEPPFNEVLAANLARYGLSMTLPDVMATFIGSSMTSVVQKARDLGASYPGTDNQWIDEIYEEGYARLRQGVDLIPGITNVLDALDGNAIPFCVATNGSQAKMDITLGGTGLAPRFDGKRFSAHELGVAKPDPDLFLIAAREMGVTPDRAVVIEDSPSGALAAKRAGMPCFGYAPEGGGKLAEQGAHVFRDMADLPALLHLK
ncbi:HAD family hydrolase [Gymnodinialimonas hymeniacidonis]|uniref:HAD family hydrolase n=1 Tax=Gymnodinialimonas hymeniacidonis TaxID=3126508 RepID=UPI0034C61DEF